MWRWLDPIAALGLCWVACLFVGLLLLAYETGWRLGRWRARHAGERDSPHIGTITAGMLGLLAFNLGLTISIAENRFEQRRQLVVTEANAIGTAWLRAGLLAGAEGPALQRLLAGYTALRVAYTRDDAAQVREDELLARTAALQAEIWALAQAVARREPNPVTALLLAALNETFDAAMAQRFAYDSRVPSHIKELLLLGSLLAVGALGYQLGLAGPRHLVLSSLLLAMWAGGLLLIVDLNRPRDGNIRADPAPLEWTLRGFGS